MSRKSQSKSAEPEEEAVTRQQKRQKRRDQERQRMLQHGRSLAKVYRDAVLKRSKSAQQGSSTASEGQKPQRS